MQYLTLLAMIPATMAAGYGYGSSDASSVAPVAAAAQTSAAASAVKGVHIVKVGQNGLTFDPESLTVPVGETVEFHFWPKAHSVSRSSFDKPCVPLNSTAFWSGPVPVTSGMSNTTFSVTVNDTNPIWFYCPTGTHCQSGMGGVINPPAANATRTLTNYKAGAKNVAQASTPAQVQGGRLGAATVGGTTPSGTASGTSPSKPTNTGAAGRDAVSWGLMGVAGLIGAAFL